MRSKAKQSCLLLFAISLPLLFALTVPVAVNAEEPQKSFLQKTARSLFCSFASIWNANACDENENDTFPSITGEDQAAAAVLGISTDKNIETQTEADTQPVIVQNITNPVIERVVNTREVVRESGISNEQFTIALNELRKELYKSQNTLPNSYGNAVAPNANVWGLSQRIDQLNGASISNGTITSSAISGASGSFTSLTASGDTTLSGALTITGTTTLGTITTSLTQGSVAFAGSGGTLSEDTSNFFWDDTNNRLGIGTTTPDGTLHIEGSSYPVLKARRTTTATQYLSTVMQVDRKSSGDVIDGFGPGISFTISDSGVSDSLMARVAAQRDGADNSGKLSFANYLNGVSTENMVITSTGNVGIGDTTPTFKLDVNGTLRSTGLATFDAGLSVKSETVTDFSGTGITVTSGALTAALGTSIANSELNNDTIDFDKISDALTIDATTTFDLDTNAADLNFDNNTLFIDSSTNRVGIGTSAPGAKLQINPFTPNVFSNVSTIANFGDNSTASYPLTLTNYKTQANGDDVNLTFNFGTGGWSSSAFIGAELENAATAATALVLGTYSGGLTERMRINSSGNVGIGTSSPAATAILTLDSTAKGFLSPRMTTTQRDAISTPATGLQIYNTTTNALNVYNGSSWAAVGGSSSLFTDGGTITYLTSLTDDLAIGGSTSSAPFYFDESAELLTLTNATAGASFRVNDAASDTTPFIIDASGNVGIGTTTPGELLHLKRNTGDAALQISNSITLTSSSGPNNPGTLVDDSSTGTAAWSNPSNATSSDNNDASTSLNNSYSHYLKATNFGFNIPSGATINGIIVDVERMCSFALFNSCGDGQVKIVKGGTVGTTDKASATLWGFSDTYTTYGSSSDLWGETWTASDINASNFGFVISAKETAGTETSTVTIDHIRITINYTDPSFGQSYTVGIDDSEDDGKFKIAGSDTLGTSDFFTITRTGEIGIGTTAPDSIKFDVEDDIEIGTGTTGCVRDADNTTLVGTCVSDERLKKNISPLSDVLSLLVELQPSTFEWRNDEFDWLNGQKGKNFGLIAQEVEEVFPDMVHEDDRGYKRVAYDITLTMRILQGVKEVWASMQDLLDWRGRADERFDEQEARIAALEAQLASASVANDNESSKAPTIQLIGSNPGKIAVGSDYADLGVTAKNSDGNDISVTITVDGEPVTNIDLDTSTDATFEIEYSAESDGQVATTTRTVIVGTGIALEESEGDENTDTPTAEVPTVNTDTTQDTATTDDGSDQTPPVEETPAVPEEDPVIEDTPDPTPPTNDNEPIEEVEEQLTDEVSLPEASADTEEEPPIQEAA